MPTNPIVSMVSLVSTHSRLKAAVALPNLMYDGYLVSTHSRLKAAVCCAFRCFERSVVSTHSRLKAAVFSF